MGTSGRLRRFRMTISAELMAILVNQDENLHLPSKVGSAL
jgi:hypothetical protein